MFIIARILDRPMRRTIARRLLLEGGIRLIPRRPELIPYHVFDVLAALSDSGSARG